MRRSFALVGLGLVISLAACGDNSDELDDPGVWLTRYVQGLCAKAHECRDAYPIESSRSFESRYGANEPACHNLFAEAAEVRSAVVLGRSLYDEGQGARCIALLDAEYAASTCEEFWADSSEPVECAETFIGQVANGEACSIHFECQSQNCVLEQPGDPTGVCEGGD